MRFCLFAALAAQALAADPYEQMRAAMQASIEKQKASIQVQAQTSRPAPPAIAPVFFTTSWPALTPSAPAAFSDCDPLPPAQLDPLIEGSAKLHGVKPDLVRAIIRKESAGKPCAVSVKGAQGLMQLMPDTAEAFHVADPFDPAQNIDAGTKFLKALLDKFKGDLSLALAAYNAGPTTVEKEGRVPQISETQDYVAEILKSLGAGSGK